MRTVFNSTLLGLAALALSACASVSSPKVDYDDQVAFETYKTFSWATDDAVLTTGDRPVNPLAIERLRNAIQSNLAAKGFEYIEDAQAADFAVAFTVGTRDGIDFRHSQQLIYVDPVWGTPYYRSDGIRPKEYTEGVLAIDIFDVSRQSPVWHAYADKKLSKAELEGQSANAAETINIMLDSFPPTTVGEASAVAETTVSVTCSTLQVENWAAWINAMPGPGASRKLMVTADVTLPSEGYEIALLPGRADRSMKPVQQLNLEINSPKAPIDPTNVTQQIRFEGPAIAPTYRAISIICDGEEIARIEDPETVS